MRAPRTYWVYIMASSSGVLYVGVTGNIERRVAQHKAKAAPGFTAQYHCNRLVYAESFPQVHDALAREKQIKGWRRERKCALIASLNPAWDDLSDPAPTSPTSPPTPAARAGGNHP